MQPIRNLPSSIWVLGFVSMLMDISSEMVHSLLPMFLVTTMGASVFVVGLIEGIAESTSLVVKVFSGAWSDYLGQRKGLTVAGYALSASTKLLFPIATSVPLVLGARFIDRIGKGVRDAPRDALIVDITPADRRGAAFGLRQSLDTVGAFLGPLFAMALMLLWMNDFRTVFWVATLPAFIALLLLVFAVQEKNRGPHMPLENPLAFKNIRYLDKRYASVVVMGVLLGFARFSDVFLVLRAFDSGIAMALVPLVMVLMNVVYAASAYPLGKLSDRMGHTALLMLGLVLLFLADLCLAAGTQWFYVMGGVALWGLHLGMTQGLMASMVASAAPENLRGTAYGFFNLMLGAAMLVSSALAGWVWDQWGASYAFYLSALWCVLGWLYLVLRKINQPPSA
jgi:MFS family permease